jgi:hypothetical protein
LSIEHIDPRNGVLVSGLENNFNEVIADLSYNSKKVNRFVPYRVCNYPAPVNEGDVGEFLIGAEIATDNPGKWVICEFMVKKGMWWQESNRIGNSQVEGGRLAGTLTGASNITKIPKETLTTNALVGLAAIPRETLVTNGKANGKASMTPEKARGYGKSTTSQRWQCLVTGHVSNPGSLARWQRSRGIDTTLRRKLE